ncbi:Zinc finger AN1 domain-containing stress-associated protein 12 [Nymphaea thermarum]|nr:Zinc finger AN1 domain-containing stress-associated protein 12 [Nymphaea thermarum]
MGERGRDLLDLGRHCQFDECHQLDFLPFKCDGCKKVFCLEHRTYGSHNCPKAERRSREVVICDVCSTSIEIKEENKKTIGASGQNNGNQEMEVLLKMVMEKHKASGRCDPRLKQKPRCPIKGCKEILTFSNAITCRTCEKKTCLKHRFPADHGCTSGKRVNVARSKLVMPSLFAKAGKECGIESNKHSSARASACSSSSSSVKVK